MIQKLRAVFKNGIFVLRDHCDLADDTEVQISVEPSSHSSPRDSDPEARRAVLRELVERMRRNPIPMNAPKFTRDELHERR